MWSAYSTRQSADLVGLNESSVRTLVRAGVVGALPDEVPARLSFRDLALLRTIRRWREAGVSLRRIRRELAAARDRVEDLSSLRIVAQHGHLVVHDARGAWRADSGQLLLPFELAPSLPSGEISELPQGADRNAAAVEQQAERSAGEWFDRALELEDSDTAKAIEAYQRVLELRPESVETLINMGRLHAESCAIGEAATCFERALAIDPNDATACYNLGVVSQDAGDDDRAVELYRRALTQDARLAEAHYNLATIYDRTGDPRAAIRHINEYRKLIRD